MKLFIESIFDKDTNKLEDAKAKAVQAANVLEKQHNNTAAAKIFYFATAIDKLIVATGDTGKKAMIIDKNVLMVKEIPDIKLGDIPTKMARYQELVIPAVDFKEKKLVFTKVKDLNDEKNNNQLGANFELTEIPNNNPVYDFEGYKVEIIDEQPKFLKIKASDIIEAEVSFMVGSFATTDKDKDFIEILINGKMLKLDLANAGVNTLNYAKIINNNTEFYANVKIIKKFNKNGLPGQNHNYAKIVKVTLRGYFHEPLNVSVLGKTNQDFNDEAYGYVQHSLELVDIKPFEIPVPYTNVATEVGGIANHPFTIKKDKPFTDGITFGAVMNYASFATWGDLLKIQGTHDFLAFHKQGNANNLCVTTGRAGNISVPNVKLPENNRPFYAQFSINFKTKTVTVTIDKVSGTIDMPIFYASEFNRIMFGDAAHKSPINYITNAWYWIGDTANLQGDTKQVNG